MKQLRLLSSSALALCFALASASAQQAITTPITTPILASDGNFRDLAGMPVSMGGTGYANVTSHGGSARIGAFYRSEALSVLNASDQAYLSSLNIGLVVDLRTGSEIAGPPTFPFAPNAGADLYIGAVEFNANIYGTYTPTAPDTTNAATAIASMMGIYQDFVGKQTQRNGFRAALLALAHEDDAALFHCSGGKDRTGWTAALLQHIAGVPLATIKNDYIASNNYLAPFIDSIVGGLPPASDQAIMLRALLGVRADYLQAALDAVAVQYGSLDAYLMQGLGLTQEDIYVLRAKMVYYQSLPGQAGFVGNAAAGAAFLNALQNSPLSGQYTRFNYYLQSAIDAGSLGGIETQVGGQVHADAAGYALRRPVWLEDASAASTSGRDLGIGRTRLWATGMGDYFNTGGATGFARSTERTGGTLAGATYRLGTEASAHFGLGYSSGSVTSAGGSATVDMALATFGARYGLTSLDQGTYLAARGHLGWIDYHSERNLAGGLGIARGDSHGALYSGRVDVGQIVRFEGYTVTPQVGLRASRVSINGFDESGSELALTMGDTTHTALNFVTDVDVTLDARQWSGWTVAPAATLGYELALRDPQVESTGTLYGFSVGQSSAYDSRHLLKAGLSVMAQRDAFSVKAGVNGALGDGSSAGVNAQVTLAYRF